MADPSQRYDLIIRDGTVIDGTGAPRTRQDVAIADDRIAAIQDHIPASASKEINAAGCIVAPGFIDTHTHDDAALVTHPEMTPKVSQGVTTVICGNCGISLAPLEKGRPTPPPMNLMGSAEIYRFPKVRDYLAYLRQNPASVNMALLVGHTTLRAGVMDTFQRAATTEEIAAMREMLEESLADGAIGMSSGLFYSPAQHAPVEELTQLAEVLGPVSGLYTAHIRDESDKIIEALEEAFQIGHHPGVRTIISHHKCGGSRNHGRSKETLELIERTANDQPVGLDAYPYTAGSTILGLPMTEEAKRVVVTWSDAMPKYAGYDLDDVAKELGCSRVKAGERLSPGGGIYFMMDEQDVRAILRYPRTMIGSDGIPSDRHPHPRLWGTFPRVLGHYVREVGLMSLEDAIHRMTGMPATQFALEGRGVVEQGAFADLTIFDPTKIIDEATYEEPTRQAEGIREVIVNGRIAWREGSSTEDRSGRVLSPA